MKSYKMKLVQITYALFLISSFQNCAQQTENKKEIMKMNNVNQFIKSFQTFSMDIQGAGLASIPNATISEKGEVYCEYAYHSEGENRKGKMTLSDKGNNRFEGNWKTVADNGNEYQGTLYFIFKASGEAEGYYKYSGSDYKITIFKKK